MAKEKLHSISQAAEQVGCSPSTLKNYERARVVEPTRLGPMKTRFYSPGDLSAIAAHRRKIHNK